MSPQNLYITLSITSNNRSYPFTTNYYFIIFNRDFFSGVIRYEKSRCVKKWHHLDILCVYCDNFKHTFHFSNLLLFTIRCHPSSVVHFHNYHVKKCYTQQKCLLIQWKLRNYIHIIYIQRSGMALLENIIWKSIVE